MNISAGGDEPLSVAFLLTQSLDSPSGLGRYFPLARGLARLGHRIEIFALHPDFHPDKAQPYVQDGVRIQYVAPMHVKKTASDKTYYSPLGLARVSLSALARLTQAALRSQARILHVGKPHPMNGPAGLAASVFTDKVLFVDCDDYEAGSNLFKAGWQKQVVAFFEKRLPQRARAVTTNSEFMRANLTAWGVPPAKIHYLPNGVDLDRFSSPPAERIAALRAGLGLEGKRVVVYVGSLSLASHAVDLLLESFSEILPAQPEAALLIVGGGEDIERLIRHADLLGIAAKVRFAGRVPPDEAATYYHIGAVSVDPVRDDDAARGRSPLKMFESWACGVPFVTSDVGDRRSLLGEPPAGILTKAGDRSALAQGILQVLADPDLARRLRAAGSARVGGFAWDALAHTVEAIYRREA